MSKSPRTDAVLAAIYDAKGDIGPHNVPQLLVVLARMLEDELSTAAKDTDRINWLEDNSADVYEVHGDWYIGPDAGLASPGLRLAIDVARKAVQ